MYYNMPSDLVKNCEINTFMIEKWSLTELERNKESTTAPYAIYYENKRSNDLLIYAGSYDGYIRGITTVRALDCNAIFLRSTRASWYLEPFPHGKTPQKVAETFDKFIDSKPHIKNVVYAGFSMGGFAALLYATWAKRINKVIVNSPQTRFPDYPVAKNMPVVQDNKFIEFKNIKDVWEKYGSPSVPVILQACPEKKPNETFHDHAECMELVGFPNVTYNQYDCVGHMGISPILLGDITAYNASFLYRP